jgi:hypothetical protein
VSSAGTHWDGLQREKQQQQLSLGQEHYGSFVLQFLNLFL